MIELARDWDLLGPRGFAIVGGAVTALGIVLLFVLATNRGWITPGMRVLFGALVSSLAVGAGFWIRSRYGQLQASLGAVGAGIAGGYASLAAASARYDVVPDWLALPLAGAIAAVAVAIAVAWKSEIVAGIGLLGSALAPALQALDTGMSWTSAAFAVIVLAATVAVAVPRHWHWLLAVITAVVTCQVAWLVEAADQTAGAGTTAVVAGLVLVVLAAGVGLQLSAGSEELDALAASFALAALGLALLLARQLYADERDIGLALACGSIVWAAAWAVLRARQPALALVLGVSALSLSAVASADLLSAAGLALTWAAQSVLFSVLARQLQDARLQVTALAYAGLAAAHVLALDAPPRSIFVDPVSRSSAVPVAALAVALAVAGLLAPAQTEPRTESGLLAWIAPLRTTLGRYRDGLREALVFAGVMAGTYAAALGLVSVSFRSGHLAATILAAAVGAALMVVTARRGSLELVAASLAWLAGVLVVAAAFDVPEFAVDAVDRSYGGWALLAAAAGVLAGCYAFQLLFPDPGPPFVPGIGGGVALASAAAGIVLLSPPGDVLASTWSGWRLLVPAAVFAVLAAAVFRIPRHRDLSTCMWALGVVALLGSESLVLQDAAWRTVAVAGTAAGLALLERPLGEPRFWHAGWGLGIAAAAGAILWAARPWDLDVPRPERLAAGPLAAALALGVVAGLAWRDRGRRDLVTCAWVAGVVALLDAEAYVIQDATWIAVAVALTAAVVAALERPLGEERLWFAGWALAVGTALATAVTLLDLQVVGTVEPARYSIAPFGATAALVAVAALAWTVRSRHDAVSVAWAAALVSLLIGEAVLLGGGAPFVFEAALTGGWVSVLALALREQPLWWAGASVVACAAAAALVEYTPPDRFVTASASPGDGLWVAVGCLAGGVALRVGAGPARRWVDGIVCAGALYALSLGILELAEQVFGGSVQTDFERGHVGVSVMWALIGLALLVAGLIRDSRLLRYGGLTLFGLSLAKIFLYDLGALSSAARALSFIAVGALVLAGGFFLQRLSSQMGPRQPHPRP